MNARVALAETREQVARCFEVIHELRPHLVDAESFVAQVLRQQAQGYQLAFVEADDEVRAAAGFRVTECLWLGKFLYVDDLVTRHDDRSRGFGKQLIDWLAEHGRVAGCAELHLDSGVQRFDAHRFYLTQRMHIVAHHFALKLL
ncbi:MAG: GNAT family N-acetyltransferase [Chthoniobacteraceae bacterium]